MNAHCPICNKPIASGTTTRRYMGQPGHEKCVVNAMLVAAGRPDLVHE